MNTFVVNHANFQPRIPLSKGFIQQHTLSLISLGHIFRIPRPRHYIRSLSLFSLSFLTITILVNSPNNSHLTDKNRKSSNIYSNINFESQSIWELCASWLPTDHPQKAVGSTRVHSSQFAPPQSNRDYRIFCSTHKYPNSRIVNCKYRGAHVALMGEGCKVWWVEFWHLDFGW